MSAELNQLIRGVAAQMPDDAAPQKIAVEVAGVVPESSLRVFLAESLTEIVRDVLNRKRGVALSNSISGGPARSGKRERLASWWARALMERNHVGGGEWKLLRDCTATDLVFCIDERRGQIHQLGHQIDNYEHIIARMKRHKATVAGDLTEDQVQK